MVYEDQNDELNGKFRFSFNILIAKALEIKQS